MPSVEEMRQRFKQGARQWSLLGRVRVQHCGQKLPQRPTILKWFQLGIVERAADPQGHGLAAQLLGYRSVGNQANRQRQFDDQVQRLIESHRAAGTEDQFL